MRYCTYYGKQPTVIYGETITNYLHLMPEMNPDELDGIFLFTFYRINNTTLKVVGEDEEDEEEIPDYIDLY